MKSSSLFTLLLEFVCFWLLTLALVGVAGAGCWIVSVMVGQLIESYGRLPITISGIIFICGLAAFVITLLWQKE